MLFPLIFVVIVGVARLVFVLVVLSVGVAGLEVLILVVEFASTCQCSHWLFLMHARSRVVLLTAFNYIVCSTTD